MTVQTMSPVKKCIQNPDEIREFGNGRLEIVRVGDSVVGRITLGPGWRWSKDVGPEIKQKSCQMAHTQYVISGHLAVLMDNGTRLDVGPGNVAYIPPGHDAWVVGQENCVLIDFTGAENYARAVGRTGTASGGLIDLEE